ncbi:MAG: DUF1697 domain-containing protein [Nitrospiria bacterium]
MTSSQAEKYIAFLRGINVGGSGILAMSELRTMCEKLSLKNVRTYIQSGNVIFESSYSEDAIVRKLDTELEKKMGKHIPVAVRSISELTLILKNNPFPKAESAKVGIMFFARPIQKSFLSGVSTSTGEELEMRTREVYIHYPNGMGRSKLKLPKQSEDGTVRNINTIQKIIELCQK